MGVKLELLVKRYYEALEEGKVLGRKCPKCGNVEWPPVYACNACGSTETEWYEMSGKGVLETVIGTTVMNLNPALKEYEPYVYGEVKVEEGIQRNALILGVDKKTEKYVRAHLPYPIHMEIIQRDGFKTAVFRIDDPAEVEKAAEEKKEAAVEVKTSDTLERLKKLAAKAYKKDVAELTADTSFEGDLTGPSVIFVGLVAQVEDEFDKLISITEASATKTLGGLAALIDSMPDED